MDPIQQNTSIIFDVAALELRDRSTNIRRRLKAGLASLREEFARHEINTPLLKSICSWENCFSKELDNRDEQLDPLKIRDKFLKELVGLLRHPVTDELPQEGIVIIEGVIYEQHPLIRVVLGLIRENPEALNDNKSLIQPYLRQSSQVKKKPEADAIQRMNTVRENFRKRMQLLEEQKEQNERNFEILLETGRAIVEAGIQETRKPLIAQIHQDRIELNQKFDAVEQKVKEKTEELKGTLVQMDQELINLNAALDQLNTEVDHLDEKIDQVEIEEKRLDCAIIELRIQVKKNKKKWIKDTLTVTSIAIVACFATWGLAGTGGAVIPHNSGLMGIFTF